MMSPIQQAVKARNKRLIIAGGILFGGFWLFLVFYLLSGGDKVPVGSQPGEVAISAVSPVATPYTPAVPTASKAPVNILHHPGVSASMKPAKATHYASSASSYAAARPVHQTSSATVHSVGGGGGGAVITSNGGGNKSGRGIQYPAMAYTGSYVNVNINAVTEVGAPSAKAMARLVTPETNDAPGPRKVSQDPMDPFLDPVGDVVWPLMLLLAGAYAYVIYLRKRTTTPDA